MQGSSEGGWGEGGSGRAQMRNCWGGGRPLLILLQPPSQHTPPAPSRLKVQGRPTAVTSVKPGFRTMNMTFGVNRVSSLQFPDCKHSKFRRNQEYQDSGTAQKRLTHWLGLRKLFPALGDQSGRLGHFISQQ